MLHWHGVPGEGKSHGGAGQPGRWYSRVIGRHTGDLTALGSQIAGLAQTVTMCRWAVLASRHVQEHTESDAGLILCRHRRAGVEADPSLERRTG